MAVTKKRVSLKKKKIIRVGAKEPEEVVITLGEKPKEETEEKPVEELEQEGEKKIVLAEKPEEKVEEEIEVEEYEEEPEEEYEEELEEEEEEPVEEEVVVISLGKPPVEEKEVVVAAVEEAEVPVEEEAVEVEVEEAKPVEEKEARKRRKLAAIIISIIVVIGSIGFYIFFIQNQDPVARLKLSPETAHAGQLILMDASNSTDDKGIIEYTWNFGDGKVYSEEKGSAQDGKFDKKTTHSYEESGDYTVKLTVRDANDGSGTTTARITVTELEVTISYEKIGDECNYEVNGSVEVENPDGLYTVTVDQSTFTLKMLHIDYDGYMISSTEGTSTQEDGMKASHETLEKYNYEDLDLSGTVSGTLTYLSITTPFNYPINDGYLEVTDWSYIDLTTNKTIFSDITSHFYLPITDQIEVSSDDHLRSYSNLREKPAVLRVEDLSPDRSFKMDDGQTNIVGDIAYTWKVESIANIKGYPSLGIQIDIDKTTKERNNIQEFDMWLWIANDVPFPIRTYIYTKVYYEGTTTTIIYNNEIQQDGFVRGDTDIPYGSCTASTPDDHYHYRNPGFEFVEWDVDDYIPDMGSNSSSLDDFPPQDAIGFAKSNSGGLQGYLGVHTSAYVIDGYYNETDGEPRWNLTFGEKDVDTVYYIIVEDTGGSYSLGDEGEISAPEIRNSTSDFDPVLSFSASQKVFENDEEVNESLFDSNGDVRFYDYDITYGAKTNMIYPSISITISLTIERTGYGYYIYKEEQDGSFSAAVDAINGQLIYVWDHEGEDILALITG